MRSCQDTPPGVLTEEQEFARYMIFPVPSLPVKEVKQGKIDFKVDKFGIVHTSIGKVSFTPEAIAQNANEFIQTLIKLKPAVSKGTYIKSIYLSSTMSQGIKVDPKSAE